MSQRIGQAILSGFSFIGVSIPILALIITAFAYFEVFSTGTIGKLIYASFVIVFFLGTSIVAKYMGEKGWMVGLGMALVLIVLHLLYYTIGIESSLNFAFLIRCCIILVICLAGGMIGVNLRGANKGVKTTSKAHTKHK